MRDYQLICSSRKTLALYVRNGQLEVRAPHYISKREIELFVASKEKWIKEKLAQSNARDEQRKNFTLNYGDTILYLGERHPITAQTGNEIGFDGQHFYMPPDLSSPQIKSACMRLYRILAKKHFMARALLFSERMRVTPTVIKVNSAKKRWGSCSGKGNINLSWRLIQAPEDVIDYVIVHELAHLLQMNHSSRFWAIVAHVLPDYQVRKEKLKAFGWKLRTEDW